MDTVVRKRTIKAPEIRRAELLDAAARLFAERGFDEVSVADITTAAQMAKGTFYLYFDSREALLDALRRRFADDMARELEALQPPTQVAEWPGFVRRFVKRAIHLQVEQREPHELLRGLPHGSDDDGHHADPVRRRLAGLIRDGVSAGAVQARDPELCADLIYELLHAAGDRAAARPKDAPTISRTAQDFIARALGVSA
jgi:AcrR family transcriptional regulator